MIKTPLSTVIGGAFWTPGATIIGSTSTTFNTIIKSLFANSEQGFAYDPNDLTTLYQDAAGTIPVTAAGQPVGLIKDKSGRNNHAYQTISALRPILQRNATTGAYYLAFDGADDFLQTNNIDFTATDKVSLFAGARKQGASRGTLVEFGVGGFGRFSLSSNRIDATSYSFLGENISPFVTGQSNDLAVLVGHADLLTKSHSLRINAVMIGSSSWTGGASVYQNAPLYIGRQGGGSIPFNGHLYSLIGIGRLTTDSETIALEKSIDKNTGVTL